MFIPIGFVLGGSNFTQILKRPFMYTLNVANNSSKNGTFVIFQESTETELRSLAWRTLNLQPQQVETISWAMDYDFVCGECASLEPGKVFKSDVSVPADLSNQNEITCAPVNGECNFEGAGKGKEDEFTILEVDGIPLDKLAIGISIDGSPIFIAQAEPTAELNIPEVNKKYFVSFGEFEKGEVLDIASLMPNAALVDFTNNEQNMELTYEENGTWLVGLISEKPPILH